MSAPKPADDDWFPGGGPGTADVTPTSSPAHPTSQTTGTSKRRRRATTVRGSVALAAKCPIPGAVKTRLAADLASPQVDGDKAAATLARGMLCDVLERVALSPLLEGAEKILLYAPPTPEGCAIMASILSDLGLTNDWRLMPMSVSAVNEDEAHDLRSPDLTALLTSALLRIRSGQGGASSVSAGGDWTPVQAPLPLPPGVAFIGMDTPDINPRDIRRALLCAESGRAYICPASDGGYGLLSLPSHAPIECLSGVRWSTSLACVGQMKALSDVGVEVAVGRMLEDVDDVGDVWRLVRRLTGDEPEAMQGGGGVDCLIEPGYVSGEEDEPEPDDSGFVIGVEKFPLEDEDADEDEDTETEDLSPVDWTCRHTMHVLDQLDLPEGGEAIANLNKYGDSSRELDDAGRRRNNGPIWFACGLLVGAAAVKYLETESGFTRSVSNAARSTGLISLWRYTKNGELHMVAVEKMAQLVHSFQRLLVHLQEASMELGKFFYEAAVVVGGERGVAVVGQTVEVATRVLGEFIGASKRIGEIFLRKL